MAVSLWLTQSKDTISAPRLGLLFEMGAVGIRFIINEFRDEYQDINVNDIKIHNGSLGTKIASPHSGWAWHHCQNGDTGAKKKNQFQSEKVEQ